MTGKHGSRMRTIVPQRTRGRAREPGEARTPDGMTSPKNKQANRHPARSRPNGREMKSVSLIKMRKSG